MTEMYKQIMGIGEPLSILDLLFTNGFVFIMLILWAPVIVVVTAYIILKIKKRKEEVKKKKENMNQRLKRVA